MQVKTPPISSFQNALKEYEFDAIKKLRRDEPNLSPRQIAVRVGRSESVVTDVLRSATINDYFIVRRERWRVYHSPNAQRERLPHPDMVTKEEFELIHELDFRGENIAEIQRQSRRSHDTVKKVLSYKTHEEYLGGKRATVPLNEALATSTPPKPEPVVTHQTPTDTSRYIKLNEMRKRLDNVMTEFLVAEAKSAYKDLLKRIYELEHENDLLRRRLEEVKDPFVETLKEKLSTITMSEELPEGTS